LQFKVSVLATHHEGFWSLLKRSVIGTYHKVSPKYLQLLLSPNSVSRCNNRVNLESLARQ
jgi:hypothetical protein